MFLPLSMWESIVEFFGMESLPDSPLLLYGIRTVSATFAGVGIFFVILALRPMNYGVMVPFSGWAAVLIGIVCVVSGFKTGMPTLWFLGDAGFCLILGLLILIFWQRAKKTAGGNGHHAAT
jgi:hypothetical protein